MSIGTGPANADYLGQFSGGQSPAGPVTSSLDSFPDSVVRPIVPAPVPPAGGGAASAAGASGGASCSWNPEIFEPAIGLVPIAGFNFSGEKYRIQPVQVPGTGMSKHGCGSWVKKLKSGDEFRDVFHSCGVLGCPVCVDGTITRKARAFEERFNHYENAKMQENAVLIPGEFRRAVPRHIIFSPSPAHIAELWTKAGKDHQTFLDLARDELKAIIKDTEIVGGAVVYHPNRVRHPDTGLTGNKAKVLLVREAKLAGNMRDDSPAADLYSHFRKQKNPARYYYFSPHFHSIVFGKIIDGHEFDEKYPGWHYINKGNVPKIGGLAQYLFSHMAMMPDRYAISWFGRLSPAVLGTEEERHFYKVTICDKTGLPWTIIESTEPDEIGKQETELITVYKTFFRARGKRKKKTRRVLVFHEDGHRTLEDVTGAMVFPKSGKRSMAPAEVHEKGILAMARYCDEFGRK